MPKGKKKHKRGCHSYSKLEVKVPTSEEESFADNCNVIRNFSELRIDNDDNEDELLITDDFEYMLKEAIDGTLQKNAKGRQTCLETVRKALCSKQLLFDFIADRKVTMSDMVERSLKRGSGEEQAIAALISALLCLQLGSEEESEVIYRALQHILVVVLTDPTASPHARAQCATSLGLCCFISCPPPEHVESIMESLHSVFSASFFKSNGAPPTHTSEISALHSSALLSWSLLLTILPEPYLMNHVNSHLRKLPELLESIDLDLRIAAGETIAVVYELAREDRKDFRGDGITDLCEKLRLLATDGRKFRAKKDRRQQRSSFRDILKAVEEGEPPHIRIKFGKEILYIDSWEQKRQYDAFSQLLGDGMNYHLVENDSLRDIFQLGTPLCFDDPFDFRIPIEKTKFERHRANWDACKARTISRNEHRDYKSWLVS